MPLVYTREEVKAYLAERGFDTRDEAMVDLFMKDLKRMLKFEEKAKRRERLGHRPDDTVLSSTVSEADFTVDLEDEEEEEETEYTPTEDEEEGAEHRTSKAKSPRRQTGGSGSSLSGLPRLGPVGDNETDTSERAEKERRKKHRSKSKSPRRKKDKSGPSPRSAPGSGEYRASRDSKDASKVSEKADWARIHSKGRDTTAQEDEGDNGRASSKKKPKRGDGLSKEKGKPAGGGLVAQTKSLSALPGLMGQVKQHEAKEPKAGPPSSEHPLSQNDTSELLNLLGQMLEEDASSTELESESVGTSRRVIQGPPDAIKRDPVALYHYYKRTWDKQSFPGENRHMKLRWNVRAETVGKYPCYEGRPVKYLPTIPKPSSVYCCPL